MRRIGTFQGRRGAVRANAAATATGNPWVDIAGCLLWCDSRDASSSGGLLVTQPDTVGSNFLPVAGKEAAVQAGPPQTWGKTGSSLNFITMRSGNSGTALSTANHTLIVRRYSESGFGFEGMSSTDDYTATVERVRLNVTAAGNLNYARTHTGATTTTTVASAAVTTGQWNTIAVSWRASDGAITGYVNGSSVGTGTNTVAVSGTTTQWLILSGPLAGSSGRALGGIAAAYNSVLSAADVLTIHNYMAGVFA